MMTIDRFTQSAQDVPQRAAEIMQRYGHNQMDTEHILLALIEQPQGMVSQIFELLKGDANALAEQLDATLRTFPTSSEVVAWPGQISITPRVMQVINLANEETNQMQDEKISAEHIFLAILSERNTPAAQLLEGAGIHRDQVYDSIQHLRGR